VAQYFVDRVAVFRVHDGGLERKMLLTDAYDVEEVEGGWLGCGGPCGGVQFVGNGSCEFSDMDLHAAVALAAVPGLGLMVRTQNGGGCLFLCSTPDLMAMWRMSTVRAAWIRTVVLAGLEHASRRAYHNADADPSNPVK
jgi:hypothetical protein